MPNIFPESPKLDPLVIPTSYTCPITGLVVPKDPAENLHWRLEMLKAAENDPELQRDLYTAASQSLIFFVNAFAFTLRVFETGTDGKVQQAKHQHLPFVTWPIQDEYLLRTEYAIDTGESLLTDKSRDGGATWINIAVYVHRFLFRDSESHLVISRKEDAVDQLDGQAKNYPFGPLADPGTLFGKVDYLLSRLPEWMLPHMARKKLHIVNLDTKSRIDGESSNATAGSSDRRTSILLDEFAKCNEAESIKRSTADVSACRLVVSTHNGAGTAFAKWRASGQIPVFALMWWDIPGKGDGRYAARDTLGRWKIRSPWYDMQCLLRSPKEVAIELDADPVGSGETFFESTVIEQHRKNFARPPLRTLGLNFRKNLSDEGILRSINKLRLDGIEKVDTGPWKVWTNLIDGRPDQTKTYTFGIDISKGQGASNSVISIGCNETHEKIAEFADANTPPHVLARITVAAALWCGGRNHRPQVIFENNGDAGFDFGRQLVHTYRYPNIYFDRAAGTLRERVGKRYGWRSSSEKKAEALGLLRRAYAHGKYVNRSDAALSEALTYIHYDGGGIGPAELVVESDSTRKNHGDRVIADMLLVWVFEGTKIRAASVDPKRPGRCFGSRLAVFKKGKRDAKRQTHFNFAAGAE